MSALSSACRRVLAASDAAQDGYQIGSAAFLVLCPSFKRVGAVVPVTHEVFKLWDSEPTKIAQLELLMVFQALITFPDAFCGVSGVFFIDNLAALMSLVKGRSDSAELHLISQSVLLFSLQCSLWFEWVPSKSNWTDAISRDGFRDSWHRQQRFQVHQSQVPVFLWRFNIRIRSCIFSFL